MAGRLKTWLGKQVEALAKERASLALAEIGIRAEKYAKDELYPGHGYLTGTLQRSIHLAQPDYNWWKDDVEPSSTTPERGGKYVYPTFYRGRARLLLGSGMHYAIYVHQGHRSFGGYHFITKALSLVVRRDVTEIIRRYGIKQ